jgi:hypothetical protein
MKKLFIITMLVVFSSFFVGCLYSDIVNEEKCLNVIESVFPNAKIYQLLDYNNLNFIAIQDTSLYYIRIGGTDNSPEIGSIIKLSRKK